MISSLWRVFEEQVIDRKYVLQKLLGTGSYGGVFLADEVVADRLIRQVAVKLMETDEAAHDAQMRELIAAANLDHSCVLRSYTCGLCELNRVPLLYLITELAEETLEDRIRTGPIAPDQTAVIAEAVASALAYLHRQSTPLVHRDIKPANIMRVNESWRLGDFGLLRAVDRQNPLKTGAMVGTAAYAPPESYRGSISPAWDMWSFGVLMAEMLSGCLPFEGEDPHRLMIAVSSQEPRLSPELPSQLSEIIRGCLEKDPADRWSAQQALDALAGSQPARSSADTVSHLSDSFYTSLGARSSTEEPAPILVASDGSGDYDDLIEAIAAASDGAVIRILPGNYSGPIVLDRPVTLEGTEAPSVVIETRGCACLVIRTEQANIRGVKLASRTDFAPGAHSGGRRYPAVEIAMGEPVFERCEITASASYCVEIRGQRTRPTLQDCSIHSGKSGGVLFADGAGGMLERCELLENAGPGIEIRSGASPHIVACVIREGLEAGVVVEGATGILDDCDISGNAGPGIAVGMNGDPKVRRCRLHGGSQVGISVRDGGTGDFERCDVHAHVLSNVTVAQGANPTLRRCRIYDGQSNGIWISQNGQGVFEECDVFGNNFAGLKVSHGGSPIVRRTTVRDGRRTGVTVHERSSALLIDCDIAGNVQAGVQVETGAQIDLRSCIVRDGQDCGVLIAGDGTIDGCTISGNMSAGIEICYGGKPHIRGCRVHDGRFVGVLAKGGAQAILENCEIRSNELPGVAIGEGSRVDVRACQILDGKQIGVVFWELARGIVEDCDIRGNALGGVRIRQGSDPLVRNSRIKENGGHGVHVSEKGEGAILDCDLSGNKLDPCFIEAGCNTQTARNTG